MKWNDILKEIKVDITEDSFENCYSTVKKVLFDRFECLDNLKECKKIPWSNDAGVYVVWEKDIDRLLYIGMTGKFDHNGTLNNGTGFKGRTTRHTPYKFDKVTNQFLYGPKDSVKKKQHKSTDQDYENKIDIENVYIECFSCKEEDKLAPAFLEAFLLQNYLLSFNVLPPANQAF